MKQRHSINGVTGNVLGTPSVKILVACHKGTLRLQTGVFTPIHVGRAIADEQAKRDLEGTIGDDTGDNISAKTALLRTHGGILGVEKIKPIGKPRLRRARPLPPFFQLS